MTAAPDIPTDVSAVFARWPQATRDTLIDIREMIFDVAQDTKTGPLSETLKWGEPAYLTNATKAGTTIRISANPKDDLPVRMLVHCQTNLIDQYRDRYSNVLKFEGDRAIRLPEGELPTDELRGCIAMALTYHRAKKDQHG